MGLCVLYYVEYSLYNVKKVGFFYLGWNYTLSNIFVYVMVDNVMGRGENAGFQEFSKSRLPLYRW